MCTCRRVQVTLTKLLSRIVPNFPIATVDPSLECRDPAVVSAVTQDPLNYHGSVHLGFAAALLAGIEVNATDL